MTEAGAHPSVLAEDVRIIELGQDTLAAINMELDQAPEICSGAASLEANLDKVSLTAQRFPEALRAALLDFRNEEPAAALIVRGFDVADFAIGPTPPSWRDSAQQGSTDRQVGYFACVASLVGELIGWATKQDGRLVHDIVPVAGDEDQQLGSGSSMALTWHTEDGFHPLRADYLGLFCLKNPDLVGTTFATLEADDLPFSVTSVLRQERFEVLPDGSHFQAVSESVRALLGDELLARGRERLQRLLDQPPPRAILFGNPDAPYLCLDQHFARPVQGDHEAAEAFEVAVDHVTSRLTPLVLEPGDVCFIDNYRAVHGRESFTARFDGTDRWFKRVNIARDLRPSRGVRASASSRIIA